MYAATKTATAVCSSAFAFGLPYDIVKAAKGDTQAFQAVASYFKTAPLSMGTMLAHHDIFAGERAGDQFRGDIAAYKEKGRLSVSVPAKSLAVYDLRP